MTSSCNIGKDYLDIISYSHLVPIAISLILITFNLIKSKFSLLSKISSAFLFTFSLWLVLDAIAWVSNDTRLIIFVWTLLDLINILFYLLAFYFFVVYVTKKDIEFKFKILATLIIFPPILLTITGNSVVGFDFESCEALNNIFLTNYKATVSIMVIIFIAILSFKTISSNKTGNNREVIVVSISLIIFLLIFSVTDFISSVSGIYEVSLYSLFVLPVFLFIIILILNRLNLFNKKTGSINLISYTVIIIIASQLILSRSNVGRVLDLITFIISTSFIVLLLETSKREHLHLLRISTLVSSLKDLNLTLNQRVDEQTAEVKKSYEYEKKARRDLEKLTETKDQFIMIAQHNLRVPVTNILNRLNKVVYNEPDSRTNHQNTRDIIDAISSAKHLEDIADDFRNIARMKVSSQILNLSVSSIKPILDSVLSELKIDSDLLNITISYPTDINSWPELNIDVNKIREVILVIIENAIRYNIQNGSIKISTSIKDGIFKMIVENTGIGITGLDKENLFIKPFYRSKKSKDLNPTGMGIGLSLSKGIIEAHHGTVTIDSKGEDLGAVVSLTIPYNFLASI